MNYIQTLIFNISSFFKKPVAKPTIVSVVADIQEKVETLRTLEVQHNATVDSIVDRIFALEEKRQVEQQNAKKAGALASNFENLLKV